MSNTANFHASVIVSLGGKAKLADALGLGRNVLTKWHVRGIPAKHWHKVVDISAHRFPDRPLTVADLADTKPAISE